MLNKNLLTNKYINFIGTDKDKFLSECNDIKQSINLNALSDKPMLIYSKNKRNAIYFILSLHYALKYDRLLDYTVITGQSLIDQHFLSEHARDNELYNGIHYDDLAFISLSQFDYTSEYLESLIINLVESRTIDKKITIISYDVMEANSGYLNFTKKLNAYFNSNEFQVINLVSKTTNSVKQSNPTIKTQTKARRIK